jgi:hypothetical protein
MIWFSKKHKCELIIKLFKIHKSVDENNSNSIIFVFVLLFFFGSNITK